MKTENTLQAGRHSYLDLVKFIAIFMMLAIHCTDNVSMAERFTDEYRLWGSIYGSAMRPSIPLFVMVTGILLFPVRMDYGVFFKKRISRVLYPFLFWAVIYNLFPWFTGVLGLDAGVIQNFFAWAGDAPSQEIGEAMANIAMIPFNFTVYTTHLWYIYLLIGLYLYMPFLSAWLKDASKRNIELFLLLFAVSTFIPYLRNYVSHDLFGTCSWNEFGTFYYFAGFNGYLVLGYYLHHYVKLDWKKTLAISLPLIAIGYIVTFVGFRNSLYIPNATEEQVELFYTYCSPNVLMMSIGVFLLCMKASFSSEKTTSLLANFSKYAFGIYLSHYLFLGPCYDFIAFLDIPSVFKNLLNAILLTGVSWAFVALLAKLPKSRYIIG